MKFSEFLISSEENKNCVDPNPDDMIASPHSNSFIDLDGDCIPDIFLTKVHKNKDGKEEYYNEIYI